MDEGSDITGLLANWRQLDRRAAEVVVRALLPDLRKIVRREISGLGPLTLDATEFVHEAYFRLLEQERSWMSRAHFLAVAAGVIRRVVIDHLRRRLALKRGGQTERLRLEDTLLTESVQDQQATRLLALDGALERLFEVDAEAALVVEQRYFVGLSIAEVAEAQGVSMATISRRWRAARAWLAVQIDRSVVPV